MLGDMIAKSMIAQIGHRKFMRRLASVYICVICEHYNSQCTLMTLLQPCAESQP